eukprot:5251699-Alexandrium_andersonii.AAC.1
MPPASGSFRCGSTPSSCCSMERLRTPCSPDRRTEPPAKCTIGWWAAPAPAARFLPANATLSSMAGRSAGYPAL